MSRRELVDVSLCRDDFVAAQIACELVAAQLRDNGHEVNGKFQAAADKFSRFLAHGDEFDGLVMSERERET